MTSTLQAPVGRDPRPAWRRGVGPATVAAAAAAAVALVGTVDPNQAGHYPTCPFLAVTGLYCPGCGSLRMVHALAHGDPATMVARNPLGVVALVVLAATWLRWTRRAVTGGVRTRVAPAWLIWTALGVVVAFWVLRNVPATAWLAP
ncbi:DUF2752 domain-containing protein [Angustibacter aerolatus]|uniref:Membrane protein n=1 Tax=Angustibacter aerolatus TaxID=1162965 RepID=A0ABQ6JCZ1_9ACTN|nr:DUF2752 domain-containing protein [Angustibacter aerolatus]GMA85070.1 membrane protein [Angustibacter aerolatus]